MWLIIAIVILFVGFPEIYSTMSIHLHIPLVIMLLGIIARGTAFAFRNYDAVVDNMQKVYNKIFVYSSFITPFFLGVIAGSAVSGYIDPGAKTFLAAYIFDWLNWFSVAIGFFTVSLCGFIAAIYLIGEVGDDPADRRRFVRKAMQMNIAAVISGALVFICAAADKIPLANWVFGNAVGITAVTAATISLVVLWRMIYRGRARTLRLLAGFQITMILLTTTYRHYPNIVILRNGYLSLLENKGADKTIDALGIALLIGSIFILPALVYLIYSFQKRRET
jgi:cytochrome d ubiquinol oxidase subunit II